MVQRKLSSHYESFVAASAEEKKFLQTFPPPKNHAFFPMPHSAAGASAQPTEMSLTQAKAVIASQAKAIKVGVQFSLSSVKTEELLCPP